MKAIANLALISTDNEAVQSLKQILSSVGYDVHVYSNGPEFLQTFSPDMTNTVILDVFLPGMSGFEIQEKLSEQRISIPVIFITGQGDIEMAVRAMKNGALDFLTKSVSDHVLLESVNKAVQRDQQSRVWEKENAIVVARSNLLTPREFEVMELMVSGLSTKAIAAELGISPSTVELHRAKVMKKMQVKSIASLVRLVLVNNLIEFDSTMH